VQLNEKWPFDPTEQLKKGHGLQKLFSLRTHLLGRGRHRKALAVRSPSADESATSTALAIGLVMLSVTQMAIPIAGTAATAPVPSGILRAAPNTTSASWYSTGVLTRTASSQGAASLPVRPQIKRRPERRSTIDDRQDMQNRRAILENAQDLAGRHRSALGCGHYL